MGKGNDLWDDSALTNAFDHAMTKYKVMHSTAYYSDSLEEVNHNIGSDVNEPILTEEAVGHIPADENRSNASNRTVETSMPCINTVAATEIKENQLFEDIHCTEPHQHSSGFLCVDETVDSFSNQQGAEYNQLLKQYYELEEQKQKVLQQLQQAGSWNYQTRVQCSTCPQQQIPTYNASEHGLPTPCCLSSCSCLAFPSISYGGCAPWNSYPAAWAHLYPGSQCPPENLTCSMDPIKQSTQADDYAVKTGTTIAERALSSMETEIPATSKACNEKEIGKENEEGLAVCEGRGSGNVALDPDLSVVLNTWYAAGFHTARYLMEQSKRRVNQ